MENFSSVKTSGMHDGTTPQASFEALEQLVRVNPNAAMKQACEAAEQATTDANRCAALLVVSRAHINLGNGEQALPVAMKALAAATSAQSGRLVGRAYNEIGVARFVSGDVSGALEAYQRADELFTRLGDSYERARIHVNRANALNRSGRFVESITSYESALQHAMATGDSVLQAKIQLNLSTFFSTILHNYDEAIQYSLDALATYESVGDIVGIGKAYLNLGLAFGWSDQSEQSVAYLQKALEVKREVGDRQELMSILFNLIAYHTNANPPEYDAAHVLYAEMQVVATSLPAASPAHRLQKLALGAIKALDGAYDEAISSVREALPEDGGESVPFDERVTLLTTLANLYEKAGDHHQAANMYGLLLKTNHDLTRTRSDRRIEYLAAKQHVERERDKAEIERLRTVELAAVVERLEKANKDRSDYLAFIAHELKEPLSTIRALADLLLHDSSADNSMQEEYRHQIRALATRMFDLVAGLLQRSAGSSARTAGFLDAGKIWKHVLSIWKLRTSEKNLKLDVDVQEAELFVHANEQQLVTVLENLVSNAMKFSPRNKTITVRIRKRHAGSLGRLVQLSVRDQGPGITAADMDRLFGAYSTLSARPTGAESSTGLGLHLVKRDVTSMDGRIWCESMPGHGATFYVELPLADSETVSFIQQPS
jgi:signal transduction histidine kinase